MKRLFILGIIILLVPLYFGCTKETLFIVDGVFYEVVDDSHAMVIGYNEELGLDVEILDKIENYPVTEIAEAAFKAANMNTVLLPNTVEIIANQAFFYCSSLNLINLNMVKQIGKEAFFYCSSLVLINLNKANTINDNAFKYCSNLRDVILSNELDIINIGLFSNCKKLSNITIPSSVIEIKRCAFEECDELINCDIPLSVIKMEINVFIACDKLDTINIEHQDKPSGWDNNWNGSNSLVVWGNNTFEIEGGFITIDGIIYQINEHDALVYGYTDNIDSDIEILSLIKGIVNVIEIKERAFYGCDLIYNVLIPESITDIGSEAFRACGNLQSVSIEGNITAIQERTFIYSDQLTNISLPLSLEIIEEEAFMYCMNLSEITFSNNLIEIKTRAFYQCESLLDVIIPSSVTALANDVFHMCLSLEEVNVSSQNQIYTSIDGVLYTKDLLTLIYYPCGRTSTSYQINSNTLTILGGAFYQTINLISVIIPSSVSLIEDEAFIDNQALEVIDVSLDNLGYASFDGILYNKDITIMYTYPNNKSNLEFSILSSVNEIKSGAFYKIKHLVTITVFINVLLINDYAFKDCEVLEQINIEAIEKPEGWSINWNDTLANVLWDYQIGG